MKTCKHPDVGVINGLWANSYGNGGIIPIETSFFYTTTMLELKLTGLQGNLSLREQLYQFKIEIYM